MPDTTLSEALREAYASAPSHIVIYHTIELRHPAFTTPIRVVRNNANLVARLESSAPENPGEQVEFVAFSFDFTKPEISTSGVPQVVLEIDNVDRAIVANIEAAMAGTDLIKVTYREYISTDLMAPQNDPPLHMTILTISADVFRVRCTAGFANLVNYRFPRTEYDADVFPGLVAS